MNSDPFVNDQCNYFVVPVDYDVQAVHGLNSGKREVDSMLTDHFTFAPQELSIHLA
jgi:hypothetical protein